MSLTPMTWESKANLHASLHLYFRNRWRDCYIKRRLKKGSCYGIKKEYRAAGSVSNIRGCHWAKMFVSASSPLRFVTPAGSTEVEGKGIPFARHSENSADIRTAKKKSHKTTTHFVYHRTIGLYYLRLLCSLEPILHCCYEPPRVSLRPEIRPWVLLLKYSPARSLQR